MLNRDSGMVAVGARADVSGGVNSRLAERANLTSGGNNVDDAGAEHTRLTARNLATKGWFGAALASGVVGPEGVNGEKFIVFKVAKTELAGTEFQVKV